jgi:hypothetical protein
MSARRLAPGVITPTRQRRPAKSAPAADADRPTEPASDVDFASKEPRIYPKLP